MEDWLEYTFMFAIIMGLIIVGITASIAYTHAQTPEIEKPFSEELYENKYICLIADENNICLIWDETFVIKLEGTQ